MGLWNVFVGVAEPLEDGVAQIDLGEGVRLEATTQKKGRVSVFLRPEDIIVSLERIRSSARNILKGQIIEIEDLGDRVKLEVAAGKSFTAIITKKSFRELRFTLGSEVYLNFKASAMSVS
jgi:molybdopterin-binding protein